jgi:hypothetical protein
LLRERINALVGEILQQTDAHAHQAASKDPNYPLTQLRASLKGTPCTARAAVLVAWEKLEFHSFPL